MKINFLDCLGSVMMICVFCLDIFEDIVLLTALVSYSFYSYFQTILLLKLDFSEYYNRHKNKNIFENLGFLKKIFFLDHFQDEFSELDDHLLRNEPIVSTLESNKDNLNPKLIDYFKSKEFLYFNFCILSEIYNKKLCEIKNIENKSFESSDSSNKVSSDPEKFEIGFKNLVDKYFDSSSLEEDEYINFEKFINYFANEKINEQNVSITTYNNLMFHELINSLNINYISIIEALNPKKNRKICKNLEQKLNSETAYNEFYSFDCFITFENRSY